MPSIPAPSDKTTHAIIKRRKVFYVPGYDPHLPRRYRELYRSEGTRQAQISGYRLSLQGRKRTGAGAYGWTVSATIDGHDVQAEYDVLAWSDLVRVSMKAGLWDTYCKLVRTAYVYISSGALWRLMRLRKGPVIAALYPIFMLTLQLVIALCAAGALALLWVEVSPWVGWGAVMSFVVVVPILREFRRLDNRLYAHYLMHDFAYSSSLSGDYPPELRERLHHFKQSIAEALLRKDLGEVLVVGHSSGAYLSASILADLIREGVLPDDTGLELNFLSLGQVFPMVSFLPGAARLRGDMQFLSQQERIAWVDVTAPGDGCSFALCDPVAVSGVATDKSRWPLVFSAAFTQTLAPDTWQKVKRRFFYLHFQYLHAFDRPKDYDYFQITAGPLSLRQRYAERPPSANRITTPTSGYTSVA